MTPGDLWSLSRVEWSVVFRHETLVIQLWETQGWEVRQQLREWNGIRLYGGPVSVEESTEAPLLFSLRPAPIVVMPLQLREQSNYRLEVYGEQKERLEAVSCFPLLSPPILRPDPGVRSSRLFSGTLNYRDYVGETALTLLGGGQEIFRIDLEVRSKKLSYLEDYVALLDALGQRWVGLLLQLDSPVFASFQGTGEGEPPGGDELFLVLRHIIRWPVLHEAWEKLRHAVPVGLTKATRIVRMDQQKPTSSREWLAGYRRENIWLQAPNTWSLPVQTQSRVPLYYPKQVLTETQHSPENQFVEQLVAWVMNLLQELESRYREAGRLSWVGELERLQEEWLVLSSHHQPQVQSAMKTLSVVSVPESRLAMQPLYRPFLDVWRLLSSAQRLSWQDVADSMQGPLRDLAKLYEYWCFFALWEALTDISEYTSSASWWSWDPQQLRVELVRGKPFSFSYRQLGLTLYYQRRFVAGDGHLQSYSVPLVPDYTLEIACPGNVSVLLCFDAKYRPERALEKMHAYRDALRGALGCYLFYPGEQDIPTIFTKDATALLPGVGAFSLRPVQESQAWLTRWLGWALEQISEQMVVLQEVEETKTGSQRTGQE